MKRTLALPFIVLAFCSVVLGQSAKPAEQSSTAHVQGTIRDEAGTVIPNVRVRFQSGPQWKTLTTNGAGEFEADMPPGLYTMDVMVHGLEPYHRPLFSITPKANLTFDLALPLASTCDMRIVGSGSLAAEKAAMEKMPLCEDFLAMPQKKGVPFSLFVQYGSRSFQPYIYDYEATSDLDPVFVAYNLFSLEADEVTYDVPSQILDAHGRVVVVDESDGDYKVQTGDWMKFKILNGQATLAGCTCNQFPKKYTRGRLFHQEP